MKDAAFNLSNKYGNGIKKNLVTELKKKIHQKKLLQDMVIYI